MSPKTRTQFLFSASILATGAAILAITVFHSPTVKAQTGITLPARFEYVAKFACGVESAAGAVPAEPDVNIGNYTTVINLHNPAATTVNILKQVEVAYLESFPNTVITDPTQRFPDIIPSNHTMRVNCKEIVNLLKINGTPAPAGGFIEGFLVIDSSTTPAAGGPAVAAALDVVEITTAAANPQGPVVSHDLLTVPGSRLAAGTWPF
jgi:hypothetical protein